MWPLLAFSIMALALILDRAIIFLRMRMNFRRFVQDLGNLVRARKLDEALDLCRKSRNPIAKVAGVYLEHIHFGDASRGTLIEREGSLALEKAEERLRSLSALAQLSTLLGLLGTVAGLVGAFHGIELSAGQVHPESLAAGIWEALLTTVFGLSVAIPCMGAYHYFEGKADRMARRVGFVIAYLDEWLGKHTPALGHPLEEKEPAIRED